MKRILSGVQPTGNIHLGNYLGALRNWVALQHEYESLFCIVNLHAITVPQDPSLLARKTRDLARIYLAAGVDPKVSIIFIQSDVPAHAELAWILNCVTRIGELERMTQFKDKAARQRESVGAGLLNYPVLMASDILLYQTDLVPVGHDQKQHLELTRDLAIRFNRDYGEAFRIPEPFIPKVGAKIMSLSDAARKMSKSDENLNGSITLLDDADTVRRKFKRAVTDSGTDIGFDESRPAITNLLTIYQILTGKQPAEVEANFAGKGYAALKSELAEVTIEFLRPLQERIQGYDDAELDRLLGEGGERAQEIARATLDNVKSRLGLVGARARGA
ncbi:MAG TPA: tryptophan--tRNA ligase [Pyrinomonadaceae bacterium]|nr:tryptophan--tRNA ligase [Pyrinomonadaceae bacterium]